MRACSFIGVPFDGAATLAWPGARYAPDEVRRHLEWMRMRGEGGSLYCVDEDRLVEFSPEQLHDAVDGSVAIHLDAHLDFPAATTRSPHSSSRLSQ